MIPKELEDRNQKLYDKLVPQEGKCDTIEGETLRAINRLIYRYYNDGDYWYDGYGTETAGPAETYLRTEGCIDIRKELNDSDSTENEVYEKCLEIVLEKIVSHIESCVDYHQNYSDMLDCGPKYTWDDEDE